MTDASLSVSSVASGLEQPTAIAFLGPDDLLVTEKATGAVRRVQGGSVGDTVLDLAVNYFDERGLLGIAVHPDFDNQPFVYLYWTWRGAGDGPEGFLGEDTEEPTEVPELGNRVDRFSWDGSALTWDRNIVQLRSNTLQTDTLDRIRGNHDAGPLVFGPGGRLFIINGDQNLRGQLQNIADGPVPDDANLTGIVLRLNDDGSIPEENPFFDAGVEIGGAVGENIQMLWAYGIRNSFGMAIEPQTGALWLTENGDDAWDEINVLPAGANSGWIQLMGPSARFDEYREIEVGTEDGLDNAEFPPDQLASSAEEALDRLSELPGSQFVEPVLSWKFPVAVTAIEFVGGATLGESSANTAFVGTVLTGNLFRYPLAEDGSGFALTGGLEDLVDDNAGKGDVGESADNIVGSGFGVVTDIAAGPDGSLFVVSLSGGQVYRITAATDDGAGNGSPAPTDGPTAEPTDDGASPSATNGSGGDGVELTIGTDEGEMLEFVPDQAEVPAGAEVSLTLDNISTVPHNLTFGEPISVATEPIVPAGQSETVDFTAPGPGDYQFVCTLHSGMDGTLTVTE